VLETKKFVFVQQDTWFERPPIPAKEKAVEFERKRSLKKFIFRYQNGWKLQKGG